MKAVWLFLALMYFPTLFSYSIIEFTLPQATSGPLYIITGPDGNLWFTQESGHRIGRITPTGKISEFYLLSKWPSPVGITSGIDGNIWFTESNTGTIASIDVNGISKASYFLGNNLRLDAMTTDSIGTLWFTEIESNTIGCLTLAGQLKSFAIPTAYSMANSITMGPDNTIWFTESSANALACLDPQTGLIEEFTLPTPDSNPSGITYCPRGTLWFTENKANKIGCFIYATKKFVEFPLPTTDSGPLSITMGPDGNVWFTESRANALGRINPITHVIDEFAIPTLKSFPFGITSGPDGNIWFTEGNSNKIGVLDSSSFITIASPFSGALITSQRPIISGTAKENTQVEVTLTNNTTTIFRGKAVLLGNNWSITLTSSLPDGNYTLIATSSDQLFTAGAQTNFTVSTKGLISITHPIDNSFTYQRFFSISGRVFTGTPVEVEIAHNNVILFASKALITGTTWQLPQALFLGKSGVYTLFATTRTTDGTLLQATSTITFLPLIRNYKRSALSKAIQVKYGVINNLL